MGDELNFWTQRYTWWKRNPSFCPHQWRYPIQTVSAQDLWPPVCTPLLPPSLPVRICGPRAHLFTHTTLTRGSGGALHKKTSSSGREHHSTGWNNYGADCEKIRPEGTRCGGCTLLEHAPLSASSGQRRRSLDMGVEQASVPTSVFYMYLYCPCN